MRMLARVRAAASPEAASGPVQVADMEAAWGPRLAVCAAGGDHPLVLLVLNYRLPRATAALWHRGAACAPAAAACWGVPHMLSALLGWSVGAVPHPPGARSMLLPKDAHAPAARAAGGCTAPALSRTCGGLRSCAAHLRGRRRQPPVRPGTQLARRRRAGGAR